MSKLLITMLKDKLKSLLSRKRTIYSILFKVTNIGGQLLIIPLVYGKLGVYEFGIFATINTIAIFSLNIDFGIVNAIKNPLQERLQKEDAKGASKIASTSFFFISFISLVSILIASLVYFTGLDKSLMDVEKYYSIRGVIFVSIVYFFIRFNFQIVHGFNHSIGKYYINDFLLMVGTVTSTISLFLMSRMGVLTLINVIHAYFAFYCIVYVVYFILFVVKAKNIEIKYSSFSLAYLVELLSNSSAFFFLQVTWIGITNYIPLMLIREVGPSIAGNYNIVSRLFNFLYVVNLIILNNFWSEIHSNYIRKDIEGVASLYNKILKISMLISIFCLLISIFYKPVISLWIGRNVSIEYSLLVNTLIYYVFVITLSTMNIFMNSINKLKIQLILSSINIVLIIVGYLSFKYLFNYDTVNGIFLTPIIVLFVNIIVSVLWLKAKVLSENRLVETVKLSLHKSNH